MRRVVAVLVGLCVALLVALLSLRRLKCREPFSFGGLFRKASSGVSKAVATTGTFARAGVTTGVNAGMGAAAQSVTPGRARTSGSAGPTYTARQWNGVDWVCITGVDSGLEGAKGCITSRFHPRMAKLGTTDYRCPRGTVPTEYEDTNGRCEVGWVSRVWTDGNKVVCPGQGTVEIGMDANRQCKRYGPFTTRVLLGGQWTCPPGTKDTGFSWNTPGRGFEQCKWLGGLA